MEEMIHSDRKWTCSISDYRGSGVLREHLLDIELVTEKPTLSGSDHRRGWPPVVAKNRSMDAPDRLGVCVEHK